MTHLDRITIRGFKSIKSLEAFELGNLNVLVGANGAGKSNFIELFRIISAMMRPGGLREYVEGTADSYFFGGPKRTSQIEVRLEFGPNGYDFDLAPTSDGFLMIQNEKRRYLPRGESGAKNFPGGTFDAQLPTEAGSSEAAKCTYNAIKSWQIYHFHDTGKYAGMRRFCDMNHNERLDADAKNIAAFLYRLSKANEKEYNRIKDAIRLVVPFFEDFVFIPNQDENIRLNWRQKGLNDYPMRPAQFSDGAIRFICLATALLQPQPPSTIIIDEPELGLHPEAIQILGEMISSAAKKTQVIVATQSPLLIDQFSLKDLIVARRQDGASILERLKEEDYAAWLEDYSVGELWTKNVFEGGAVHE